VIGRFGFALAGLFSVMVAAPTAFAQATGCPAPAGPGAVASADSGTGRADTSRSTAASRPDIILLASIQASALTFHSQPRATVRFCWGNGQGDTLRVIERTNLPSPIVAGTTYRDVRISVEILGHLDAVCLLRDLGIARRDGTAVGKPCPSTPLQASGGVTPGTPPDQ
jgi:hypothetical protein